MSTGADSNDGTPYSLAAEGASSETEIARDQSELTEPNISRQAISGIIWLTIQKWAIRLMGFVTIAILTRLLSPEDFGAVAAASTVLPFFYLIADFGFAAYIVQAEKADQRLLSTGFWFSSIAGVGLCGVLVLAAPLFGQVYDDPQTVPILQVLSLSALATALGSVPGALLRRSMRFRTIAGQGAIAAGVGQVIGIVMAVTGFGAWALVGQTLSSGFVGCLLVWIAAKWRPSLTFSRSDFLLMTRFGSQVLGVEFVAVLRTWAEAAIISTSLGIAALGYMNIAQRLVLIVQELTGGALIPVSTVAFAKVRDSSERVTKAYMRALKATYATLSLPLVFLGVTAPLLVPIVFGDGWGTSAQLTQILALAGILTVGAALDHGLFYGLGKPGTWFAYAVLIDAITVGTTAVAVRWGLLGVAWSFLAVALLATIARWFLVGHLLEASVVTLLRPFVLLAVMVTVDGAAGLAIMLLTGGLPALVAVAITGLGICVVHFALIKFISPGILDEVVALLGKKRWSSIVAKFSVSRK